MLFERGYENFLYLHHLDLLVWIPTYAEEIDISQKASFSQSKPLGAPNDIYSFGGSGPRTVRRSLLLDRDMMQIMGAEGLVGTGDPIETLIRAMECTCVARYADARKMIDPPLVTYKEANEVTITGVVLGGVNIKAYGGWKDGRKRTYSMELNISEIEQYDAQTIMAIGQYRGLSATLMQRMANYGR